MGRNTRKTYFPNPQPDGFYSGNTAVEKFVGLRENYYAWTLGNALFVVLDPYWYMSKSPAEMLITGAGRLAISNIIGSKMYSKKVMLNLNSSSAIS